MTKLKIILGSLLLLSQMTVLAQNQQQLANGEEYCTVRFIVTAFSSKVWAEVDFGKGEEPLKDSIGNPKFHSRAEILNYIGKQGWVLVTSYKGISDTYLIFRRRLITSQEVLPGKQ